MVPFLLVVTPLDVKLCFGFEPPGSPETPVAFDPLRPLPEALAKLSAERISSSVTWRDLEVRRSSSVDNRLVGAIGALNDRARRDFPAYDERRDLVNGLIGKFLYLYVLIDRGILSAPWVARRLPLRSRVEGLSFLRAVFHRKRAKTAWTARAAFSVFDVVDGALNGSVFGIEDADRRAVPDGLCHLIHRVVRGGETLFRDGSQLAFFDVNFRVLRTETISAIYERFVSIEDAGKKRDDGVYYTPPHLADHVLDRIEAVSPLAVGCRIVDPAAGSGIFLVGAFRRLMERARPPGGWRPSHAVWARSLLLHSIHGIEKHPQAANVCRFSLYLTLLDYVGRAPIQELVTATEPEKFLPDLWENILTADAFTVFPAERFTHVVGNPPWSMAGGQKDRTNSAALHAEGNEAALAFASELAEAGIGFGQNRLSDLFAWLGLRRFAVEGATFGLVLPARSLVGRLAGNFAHCLARETTVRWVGNLSHLRRKLFEGVEAPAYVVVAVNRRPFPSDRAALYRPLLPSLPGGRRNEVWSLLASNADIRAMRAVDLQKGPSGWFTQTMLGESDRRMHEALRIWSDRRGMRLLDFLARSGLQMSKGGSPAESGVQRGHDGNRAQKRALSRDELLSIRPTFRGWFSGNVILVPRSLNDAEYHREPIAYSSTYNAVIPTSQYVRGLDGVIEEEQMPYMQEDGIAGFLGYLNSGVLRYFASLFGATYLMDKARFEKHDLLSLPCPYLDVRDPRLLRLGFEDQPDLSILDAMDAGDDFRSAFHEFDTFRKYYANAQTPSDSLTRAPENQREQYVVRLRAELHASFGTDLTVAVSASSDRATHLSIAIAFGGATMPDGLADGALDRFVGSSIVSCGPTPNSCTVIKTPTRHAWTIEQAVADAVAICREMRFSH